MPNLNTEELPCLFFSFFPSQPVYCLDTEELIMFSMVSQAHASTDFFRHQVKNKQKDEGSVWLSPSEPHTHRLQQTVTADLQRDL